MGYLGISLVSIALAAAIEPAPEAAALAKLERHLAKQPRYTAPRPLYGLLVLGPQARTRIWMVLDKSKPEADRYDVLYADVNGNGDLGEADERFAGHKEGDDLRFRLPDLKDPASDVTHTEWSVRVSKDASPDVMVSLKWRGGPKMGGGYPQEPDGGYLKFANTPAEAPILWANGDGPFRFQRWYSSRLTVGGADDLKVFLGQQGIGTNSFWAFQEHVLPAAEGVQATLLYRDAEGRECQAVSRLKERC